MVVPVGERYQQTLYLMRKTDGKLKKEALRATLEGLLELLERHLLAAAFHLGARVVDNVVKHAHTGASSLVSDASASNAAAARPSSIAASAVRTPS